MTQGTNNLASNTSDEYLHKLHHYKLARILLMKMVREKLISDTEFSRAMEEVGKLYKIKD